MKNIIRQKSLHFSGIQWWLNIVYKTKLLLWLLSHRFLFGLVDLLVFKGLFVIWETRFEISWSLTYIYFPIEGTHQPISMLFCQYLSQKKMGHSFCFISLAMSKLQGWEISHLKTDIHWWIEYRFISVGYTVAEILSFKVRI